VRILDLENKLIAERDANEEREPFTPSERVAIAQAIERRAGERRGRPAKDNPQKIAEIPKGKETRGAASRRTSRVQES
jgi:hypothetical protein